MEGPQWNILNQTTVSFFIIKGFSDAPKLQAPIFFLVLLIYLLTLSGNITILSLVCLDHHLRTPMYFFLGNLSINDMSSATVTLHNILLDGLSGNHIITRLSYIAQMHFVGTFFSGELLLLTAMSYDRYVAICNPLRYTVIMNYKVCVLLATSCWLLGFIEVIPYASLVAGFKCYKSNIINHFFCDLLPIIHLSCDDTSFLETLLFIEAATLQIIVPFTLTFLSYVFIINTIVRIPSSTGRHKAFHTCSSHLTVVVLLYTTLTYQYLKHTSENNLYYNKVFSLFNTAAIPVLNPLIYSLKNENVKTALKKRLHF